MYPLDVLPGQHQKHKLKVGEFLVYFYGSHNSAFVHRGQVFHYHDGVRKIFSINSFMARN